MPRHEADGGEFKGKEAAKPDGHAGDENAVIAATDGDATGKAAAPLAGQGAVDGSGAVDSVGGDKAGTQAGVTGKQDQVGAVKADGKVSKKGCCSVTCCVLSTFGMLMLLVTLSLYQMSQLAVVDPAHLVDQRGRPVPTYDPAWPESTPFTVDVCLLPSKKRPRSKTWCKDGSPLHVTTIADAKLDWSLDHGWRAAARKSSHVHVRDVDDGAAVNVDIDMASRIAATETALSGVEGEARDSMEKQLASAVKVWDRMRQAKAVYAHVWVQRVDQHSQPLHLVAPMTQEAKVAKPPPPTRYLLLDVERLLQEWFGLIPDGLLHYEDAADSTAPEREDVGERKPHWRTSLDIRVSLDFQRYPRHFVPPVLNGKLRVDENSQYMPIVRTNPMRATTDALVLMNSTMTTVPLSIYLSPISMGKWVFLSEINEQLVLFKQAGLTDADLDDVVRMYSETPNWLLALTLTVSMVHMAFDILAMKADFSFWKNTKSFKGLSLSSQIVSFVCQLVITLYLYDEDASPLVLYPNYGNIALTAWKISKMLHVTYSWKLGFIPIPSLNSQGSAAVETATRKYDRIAIRFTSGLLAPMVVTYSLYSLGFLKHKSWYAWGLGAAVQSVYAFGFALMTPQLYINYKLKSVAHMPLQAMVYRSMNTFIDDLFAFIIKMPLMHRLSCFRDDVVFLLFLAQRFYYPVDKSRRTTAVDDEEPHEKTE